MRGEVKTQKAYLLSSWDEKCSRWAKMKLGEYVVEKLVQIQRKIAPDFITVIEDRYNILRHIHHAGPIGRRALAGMVNMGERIVRAQVDFLKSSGLVDFSSLGMTVTADGQMVLTELEEYIRLLHGLTLLEEELAAKLGIGQVVIIPGDSDVDVAVQRELGRAAAVVLSKHLQNPVIIAVSGGSTMARVADAILQPAPTATVVPARGGLGEQLEYQANIIAAVMATKLGGQYRLLHIPDGMTEEALSMILASDASVANVASMIKRADILVHGIGRAQDMALRRRMEASSVESIAELGAVGEALGHYYTLDGTCVYVTNSVGLRLSDLAGIGCVVAVAGGRDKAEAIVAVTRAGGQDVLIIDEAAAGAIQTIINQV